MLTLCLEALEFIPNSVRVWKEAVSLEAFGELIWALALGLRLKAPNPV